MTRFSPRTALRRAAGSLAAAGLLAAASLAGAAAPAQAADTPVFTLGGPAETGLHPYPESGRPKAATVGITLNNPSEDEENGGFGGAFTLTFDLSGVAGVADVAFDGESGPECEVTGAKAVCEDWGVWPGLQGAADLIVTAADGSEDGATGTITVTGEANGAAFTPFTTRLTVGGPDLVMKPLPFRTELTPGDKQQAPITFANRGTRDADGVLLTMRYSRGLDIPQRYSNCEYTVDDPDQPDFGWTTALCSVEGAFEAGATYTLATPLTLEATKRAFYDAFLYRIEENSAAQRTAQRAGARFERGAGAVLKAVPVTTGAAARSVDLDPYDNQQEADFRTENSADFVAYGGKVAGPEGSTVEADIGFRNEGPAWIGYIRSGEDVATVDFTVPEGTSVTAKPDRCRAVTADGKYREDQKSPAPRYVCNTSMTVRDGSGLDLSFELRIDKGVVGASGEVTVRNTWLQNPKLPFDPEPANNTAYLIVNGEGEGSESGGTTGGTDGGSGEPSTPPTSAPDPEESPSGTNGPSEAATSSASGEGPAGTAEGSGGGGGLASTGSTVLIASGAAAAALAAGLLLFTAARRRAAAQHV
ncbi:peptidase [Streptomyces sp. ISL-112]|uniref:peptidase n=1 Tax=unclassified Streptomyces TaxID=2593676 RepID=UPI001BEA6401|nr:MULTISPECIES: peptidase [unclassified Streptomyces]MBT2424552.1 peptidase [Streptomyces sp. ISL-112]MBT2465087.1 peptidase [Streptomyces sp. ISL-63]